MSKWGELRLLLQTSVPGLSLDLCDEWLNERYKSVLSTTDWYGLKNHSVIQTVAAHQSAATESVTLTVGSASVAGAGTNWTDPGVTGRMFFRPGDNVVYTVAALLSPMSLTLDRPYEGVAGNNAPATVYAGAAYTFMTDIYALPADARAPVTIINPVTANPMGELTKDQLDFSAGTRATVGDPWVFAIFDDTSENLTLAGGAPAPVLHQVQFYRPPLYSRGYALEYLREANYFDGTNTGASPLPFVTDTVILAGARADAWLHLGNLPKAAGYAAQFSQELGRMLLLEHAQRRKTSALHMDPRFTRHRLARLDRQWGRGWGPGQGGPS